MFRHIVIAVFVLLIADPLVRAQDPTAKPSSSNPELKTLEDQAAYAIGLDLGEETLANAPDLNPDLVARGLLDAMRNAKPLLSKEKAQAAMDQFMAKKLGPGAEKNLKDGQEFLAKNKNEKGVIT